MRIVGVCLSVALLIVLASQGPMKSEKSLSLRPLVVEFVGFYELSERDHQRKIASVLHGLCDFLHVQLNREPRVKDFNQDSIHAYFAHLEKLYAFEPVTMRSKHATVKQFARFLADDYGIRGIARKIKIPKVRQVPKRSLTKPELLRLREAIQASSKKHYIAARNTTIYDLLRWTGLREHEVVGLRMMQVNFKTKTILGVQGKGGRYDDYPMHPRLVQAILEYVPVWIDYLSRKDWKFRNGEPYVSRTMAGYLFALQRHGRQPGKLPRKPQPSLPDD